MLISNYSARSGLIAQQQRMDIIANNMANVNTSGFKNVRADFKDMLYQEQVRVVQPQDGLNLQKGHGIILGATTRSFMQGAAQNTANMMDFMLVGDGFFAVQNPDGDVRYTRDGSFAISVEEDGNYLVNNSGYYLLNADGERINIQDANGNDLEVDQNGNMFLVTVVPATDTAPATQTKTSLGKLGLYSFINRSGLEATSGNLFAQTVNSGEAVQSETTEVVQGMLEMSNVDVANEMTRMIRAQRAFQLASRALTTADQMDGLAATIRS